MPAAAGTYVPTLSIRASEMNGLEFLPALSKDRMTPLFLLAPWASSKSLDRTMERIERAYRHRPYFLDLDRYYFPTNLENPAQAQWLRLRDPSNNFSEWRAFCSDRPQVIPCLQLDGQSEQSIAEQVTAIQAHGREFCLRIELARIPQNLANAVDALVAVGTADFTVVIDGGWVEDALSMHGQALGLINGVLASLDGRIPIVVSCTSIPKGFHFIEGIGEVSFTNRNLVEQIARNSNRDVILYGDWGSTKPREYSFAQAPLPRIDYPLNSSWLIARNKNEDWSYEDAARALIRSNRWDGQLGIWGERMIEQTVADSEFGIDTPQKNVAARVNIHLHRQALHGQDISGINLDEDWED